MSDKIIPIKARFPETCKEFIAVNQVDPTKYLYSEYNDHALLLTDAYIPFYFQADRNKPDDPAGYSLHFGEKDPVILPAGRFISVMHDVGLLYFITCLLPLETVSFDQALQMCRQMAKSFENRGYKLKKLNEQLSQKTFGDQSFDAWDIFGTWVISTPLPIELNLVIKNYNKMSFTTFTTPLSAPIPIDAPATYLVEVSISLDWACNRELFALRKACNLAVNGDEKKPIPIKIWFDDPDWRPEGWQGKWL